MVDNISSIIKSMQDTLAAAQGRIEHLEQLLKLNQITPPPFDHISDSVYQSLQTTTDADIDTMQRIQAALAKIQSHIDYLEELLRSNQITIPPLKKAPNPVYQSLHSTNDTDRLHLYEALLHNALDGIIVVDLVGNLIYSNPAFRRMTYFGDKAEQSTIAEYFEPEDWQRLVSEILPQFHQKGLITTQLRYRRYDGSHFIGQVSAFIVFNAAGDPIAQAVLVRDITEDVESEKQRDRLQHDLIVAQQNKLRELSAPLLPIADEVILMPIVGEIDNFRTEQLMETLLNGIAQYQATIAIIDITGVKIADTQIANGLIQIARAAQLLGSKVIVSGISAEMAQTLVLLDTNLDEILTLNSLQSRLPMPLTEFGKSKQEVPPDEAKRNTANQSHL
jgi:PAS domain S-box-containing protein